MNKLCHYSHSSGIQKAELRRSVWGAVEKRGNQCFFFFEDLACFLATAFALGLAACFISAALGLAGTFFAIAAGLPAFVAAAADASALPFGAEEASIFLGSAFAARPRLGGGGGGGSGGEYGFRYLMISVLLRNLPSSISNNISSTRRLYSGCSVVMRNSAISGSGKRCLTCRHFPR